MVCMCIYIYIIWWIYRISSVKLANFHSHADWCGLWASHPLQESMHLSSTWTWHPLLNNLVSDPYMKSMIDLIGRKEERKMEFLLICVSNPSLYIKFKDQPNICIQMLCFLCPLYFLLCFCFCTAHTFMCDWLSEEF